MPGRTVTVYPNELYHHGIKGQKWGVRRFQNPDGTRTEAGKKREAESSVSNKKKVATIAGVAAGTAALAAGAIYASKHKEEIAGFIIAASNNMKGSLKVSADKGKAYVSKMNKDIKEATISGLKEAPAKFAEGIKNGLTEGATKAGRIAASGAVMLASKKALDKVVGKTTSEKIYKANNNKKVDSFWKVYDENFNNNKKKKKDEDDDDD